MQLSTASLEADLRNAFSDPSKNKVKKNADVVYMCKDGTCLVKDSPKLCCNQCLHAKQINKGTKKAWYCNVIHGKTKSFSYCESFAER